MVTLIFLRIPLDLLLVDFVESLGGMVGPLLLAEAGRETVDVGRLLVEERALSDRVAR